MSDEKNTGIGEHARALREDFAPAKLESKLQEVIEERPKTRHLLDFSIVREALLAAVIVALVLWLLFSPQLAAIALVVVFVGGWLLIAQLSYDKRRDTRDTRDTSESDPDPDPSGYAGDRGEVEAEQEQEGDAPSRNGSTPDPERAAT
jgi:hypothetical protein